MRNTFKARSKQGGVSLIELVVYLAIGLLIVSVGAAAISRAMGSSDKTGDADNINTLLVNTADLRDSTGYGTSGLDLTVGLKANGGIPATMTYTGGKLYNAYQGQVTIVSTGLAFTLTTPNIPQDACIQQVLKLSKPGIYTVSVNGGAAVTGQMTQLQAQSGCSADTNTISFTRN